MHTGGEGSGFAGADFIYTLFSCQSMLRFRSGRGIAEKCRGCVGRRIPLLWGVQGRKGYG